MIFFCNLPFVFFAGKVALLAVVYECFYTRERKETDALEKYNTSSLINDDNFGSAESKNT